MSGRLTSAWRYVPAVVVASSAGLGAAVVFASDGAASTLAAVQPQVQVVAIPSSAYTPPLTSAEIPLIAAPDGQGEWAIVNGSTGGTLLEQPITGGTAAIVASGLNNSSGPFLSLVSADGSYYTFADHGQAVGFSTSGQVEILPSASKYFSFDAHDVTADANGNLYIPDSDKSELIQALVSQLSGNLWTVPKAFSSTNPQAIATAGGLVWFTTSAGQLGSFDPSNSSSQVSGPYPETVNGNGHTLTVGADGNLWAVGGGGSGAGGNAILKINPANGQVLGAFTGGLPPSPGISAITSGPDGNIWFTESGAAAVGQLNISTGAITNYPLPAGDQLPAPGSDYIASGPGATVFFDAQVGGAPAIGEIGGPSPAPPATTGTTAPPPATTTTTTTTTTQTTTATTTTTTPPVRGPAVKPGNLSITRQVRVTAKSLARVHVACRGSGPCAGRLTVLWIHRRTVRVGKRRVSRRIATSIGTARFHLQRGRSADLSVRLSRAGTRALASTKRHRLNVSVRVNPAKGRARTSSAVLVASALRHDRSGRDRSRHRAA